MYQSILRAGCLFFVCCVTLAGLAPLSSAQGDDTVRDFRKFFREAKTPAERVEYVLSLEKIESPGVVDVLVPVLKLVEEPDVVRAAIRVLAGFKTAEPVAALIATAETDKTESVRLGILQAIAQAHYGSAAPALLVLITDKSWDVRRRAIEALGSLKDPSHAPVIAPYCADSESAVRSSALDALATLKSELVIAPAIGALNDSVWQVRTSAIAALGKVRRVESIEPLIQRLAVEEGRLRPEIGAALDEISGKSLGARLDAWQAFWGSYKSSFKIPSDAELAKLRAKQKADRALYKPAGQTNYHGIETPSRSILFVIDVSGSMENLVVEKERFQDGGYPSMMRIDIVKTELARTIDRLEPYVKFNVLSFGTDMKWWKNDLVPANALNKKAGRDYAMRLEPLGGSSKEDLASVGLAGSAGLEAGKTNTWGALSWAIGVAGRGTKDKNYEVAIDTVFFLSDGRPSHGAYVDPEDILREFRAANKLRKVVLHTIAIGEFQKDFMKRLAEENGGVFVDLGR